MRLDMTFDSKQLVADFSAAGFKITAKSQAWVNRTTLRAERAAKMEVADNTDTGRLQSGIVSMIGILRGEVNPTAKHSIYVHDGRRPGAKMPPFGDRSSLGSWARRKGIPAFAVARSIQRKGIKADPFMDIAYTKIKPHGERESDKLLGDIVRSI